MVAAMPLNTSNPTGKKRGERRENDGPKAPFGSGVSSDLVAAFAIITICVALFVVTLTFKKVPAVIAQGVQPSLIPQILLIAIAVLAVLLAIESLRRPSEPKSRVPRMVYKTGALFLGLIVTLPYLGVLLSLILFAFCMPILWGERRMRYLIPYAILLPLSVDFLFTGILNTNFPTGLLSGMIPWR